LTTGAPALDGALSNFDCIVEQQVQAGTHSIFIGRIVGARVAEGAPLVYGDGRFTSLAAAD
jgi:flavin reductase (DIM6/NTAB) family NADH-FMN oxidoreductase RutF